MWYEKDPSIVNANSIEGIGTDIIFSHKYLKPITPSKRKFKRDFVVERKDSFDIAGISFHYYRNDLYLLGDKFFLIVVSYLLQIRPFSSITYSKTN